jgi:arsenate reductase
VTVEAVTSLEQADRLGFHGSPTVRIDGVDLEGADIGTPSLECRSYENGAGAPERWLVEAAALRALKPKHVLFLCVANSARSQMAEGVGRALAPAGTRVSSAGSEPSRVRPQAVAALAEIGIDASAHRSKSFDEFGSGDVDCVITLCAEENCPVWLGDAWRVHWALPDPAAATGTEDEVLDSFRSVRRELEKRLAIVFGSSRAPAAGDRTNERRTENGMVVELNIEGMSCEHCTGRVEKALGGVEGVSAVEVRLDPASATVSGDNLSFEDLVEAVDRVGFTATRA